MKDTLKICSHWSQERRKGKINHFPYGPYSQGNSTQVTLLGHRSQLFRVASMLLVEDEDVTQFDLCSSVSCVAV